VRYRIFISVLVGGLHTRVQVANPATKLLWRFMVFKIMADAEFEAEDIDDALDKLSEHFKNVMSSELILGGKITVSPMGR